jgi:hypothetical protein
MALSLLSVSALYTKTLGLKITYGCMASLSAPPANLKLQFREFWIFGPRVSQFFVEIPVLGFLQLIEGSFQLTSVILTFKAYFWKS